MNKFFDFSESTFNFDRESSRLTDNMNYLKSISVKEFTLYKKWIECKEYKSLYNLSTRTKSNIWFPKNIYDKESTIRELHNLIPKIKIVKSEYDVSEWLNLRLFSHTMPFDQAPGRLMRFLIYDEITGKHLGAISLSSDVVSLTVRDNYIGWTKDNKYIDGKLNNTAIASCIMSTQPFGYNFLGGKLVASLLATKYVRDCWKEEYGDALVGITTTSLYGSTSMYDGIPYWKNLGESAGKVYIKPDDEFYEIWHKWLKENKKDEYNKITTKTNDSAGPVTGIKQRILYLIFKYTNIKASSYVHGFKRGVYFLQFYENSQAFLRNEIQESDLILKPRISDDYDGVISWWRKKAENRYIKLHTENNIKKSILFYNKVSFLTWDETKELYLSEVGR
jgi:hypothetical protein